MNDSPVISVCIPAYRRSGFLRRLLDSLAIQTYRDFEIVLTDDSPDDEVGALVRTHTMKEKIRYFKNPAALGTPENWNEGLRQAKGQWIKIMHDDDWFATEDSLGRFAAVIPSKQGSFYFSFYNNVTADGKITKPFSPGRFADRLAATPELLLASNRIGPPSVVLFRAMPEMFFDRRMRWLVDIDFYIRYLRASPPAVFLPEALVNIGISESQVTQTSFGNPAVEVPERMLLGEKLNFRALANPVVYNSWWRFLRNAGIRSEEQLRQFGAAGEIPRFLSSMISWQNKMPAAVLQSPVLSRILVNLHRFTHRSFRRE